MKRQWTKKEAWDWYNSLSWIRGFNGYPYDEKEIECIKYYCLKADQDFKAR